MNKELPLFYLDVDEESGAIVNQIAVVNQSAIESNFLAFSEMSKLDFKLEDEKRELLGAAMIPEKLIYRRDENGYEYNVKFTADTIRKIAQTFFKNNYNSNLNVEHTSKDAKSYVFQSFIVDKDMGIDAPKSLEHLPNGTWIIGVKVTDEGMWNDIKSGKQKGFSVEGYFLQKASKKDTELEQALAEFTNVLAQVQSSINYK